MTHAEAYRQHQRTVRVWLIVLGVLLAVVIALLIGWYSWAAPRIEALSMGLDSARKQIEQLGGDPVVPAADEVIENPAAVASPASLGIDPGALQVATMAAVRRVVPSEVASQIDDAVTTYVAGCVASGDCVGPAGPVGAAGADGSPGEPGERGADGRSPGPGEVVTAVLTVCSVELDCEATPDEIAAAVAAYCGQETQPCGTSWTEKQILDLATRATVDYLSGRPVWCPSEDEIANDQPFGPCYVSSG